MDIVIANFALAFMALAAFVSTSLKFMGDYELGRPSKLDILFVGMFGGMLMWGVLLPVHDMLNGGLNAPSQSGELLTLVCLALGVFFCAMSVAHWRQYRRSVKLMDYFNDKEYA